MILKLLPWPSLLFFLETGKQSTHPQRWCPGPYPSGWIYPLQRTRGSMETPLYNHTGKSAQQQNCLITLKISPVPSVILNETPTDFQKILTQLLINSKEMHKTPQFKRSFEIRLHKGKNGPKSFSLSHSGEMKPDAPEQWEEKTSAYWEVLRLYWNEKTQKTNRIYTCYCQA